MNISHSLRTDVQIPKWAHEPMTTVEPEAIQFHWPKEGTHLRVQARSRGGRCWCWTLKLAHKRSRAGRWSWAQKVGLFLLQLFLSSSATDIVLVSLLRTAVETATAWYTSCCTIARGHCLNILVVLAAVHVLLGLPGRCARWSLHSFAPVAPVPVPNKPPRFCGRKATMFT